MCAVYTSGDTGQRARCQKSQGPNLATGGAPEGLTNRPPVPSSETASTSLLCASCTYDTHTTSNFWLSSRNQQSSGLTAVWPPSDASWEACQHPNHCLRIHICCAPASAGDICRTPQTLVKQCLVAFTAKSCRSSSKDASSVPTANFWHTLHSRSPAGLCAVLLLLQAAEEAQWRVPSRLCLGKVASRLCICAGASEQASE